jgi:hypothetical protein
MAYYSFDANFALRVHGTGVTLPFMMRHVIWGVTCIWSLSALAACSSNGGSGAASNGATGGATSKFIVGATGGTTSAVGGTTGGARTAATAVGGTGSNTTARVSECQNQTAKLSGVWDGASASYTYASRSHFIQYTSSTGSASLTFYQLDSNGFVVLRGMGAATQWDGILHTVTPTILTPTAGPDPQSWYCGSASSTLIGDTVDKRVDLQGLGRLGTCAQGTAVSGQVTVCWASGFQSSCDYTRSGELDGIVVSPMAWDGTGGSYGDDVTAAYEDGMLIRFYRVNSNGTSGTITNAFVITAPDSPWGGSIYCAGVGSAHANDPSGQEINTLINFTKVGSCASVTGSNQLAGCLQSKL